MMPSFSFFSMLALFAGTILLVVGGCANSGGGDASAETEEKKKGFSIAGWLGKNENDGAAEEDPASSGGDRAAPKRLEIGIVHLVHTQGRFVLIQASRQTELPPRTEMLTYNPGGRPTGKLRLSPERKGAFLVADIVQGSPNALDTVEIFGIEDAGGRVRVAEPTGDGPQVLE